MKWLIADTYYPNFVRGLYARHSGLASKGYQEQRQAMMDQFFGTSDFYSFNLKRLGHEADEIPQAPAVVVPRSVLELRALVHPKRR